MSNVGWYILITVISIIFFIFTLLKKQDKKIIALYTFLSGLTYLFEYVILVIFNSYIYHPNIMKNHYFDSILGAVVSDAFTVPMIGTLIGAFQLRWKWMFFIISVFFFVEETFVYVGAYEHFWWKSFYTVIGLFLCFTISKMWYKKMKENLTVLIRFFTLYFTCLLLQTSIVFILVAFFNLYRYQIGLFENETRDHVFFATTYTIFFSFIFTCLVTFHVRWVWKVVVVLSTLSINWILLRLGILHLSNNWSLGYFLIIHFGVLIFLELFNYRILNSPK